MNDPRLTDCPACGQAELFRKISAVAFRLKGSGWYETDFKSGDKRQLHDDGKSDSNSNENGGQESSSKVSDGTASSSEGSKSSEGGKSSSDTKKDTSKDTKSNTTKAA